MTLFGWDASHYDGTLSSAILARARAEGVSFFTHKVGEGTSYDDPGDTTALAAARAVGIEFIGGYFVVRSTSPVRAQVDECLWLADRDEPWWRTLPGWFWQVDLERWPYDSVPASVGIDFANQLRARTGRWTILYASKGQYGDGLGAWNGPLWNANYGNNPVGDLRSTYPGDGSTRWSAYSGKTPTFLQYGSAVTIAGLTTCDANAYRGTTDQLRTLIEGVSGMEQTDPLRYPTPNAPTRTVGNTLTDIGNLRDWFIGAGQVVPGDASWPHPNSPAAKLAALVQQTTVTMSQADRDAIVAALVGTPTTVTLDDATINTLAQKLAAQLGVIPTIQQIEDAAYRGANRAEDS